MWRLLWLLLSATAWAQPIVHRPAEYIQCKEVPLPVNLPPTGEQLVYCKSPGAGWCSMNAAGTETCTGGSGGGGSGTVTSLAQGTGITLTGPGAPPITTSGTISLTTPVAVANGGTNLTASLDDNIMVGNGTTWESKAVPSCSSSSSILQYTTGTNTLGCITTFPYASLSGTPSTFAPAVHNFLDSTVHNNTLTGTPAQGDLIVANATPAWAKLAKGTSQQALHMDAGGNNPVWGGLQCDGGGTGVNSAVVPCAKGFDNLSPINPSTGKGQIIAGSGAAIGAGTVNQALAAGTNGQTLHADSTQTLGLRWDKIDLSDATQVTGTGTANQTVYATGTGALASTPMLTFDQVNTTVSANVMLGSRLAGGAVSSQQVYANFSLPDVTLTMTGSATCVGDSTPSTCEFDPNDTSLHRADTDTGGPGGQSRGGKCSLRDGVNWCWCDAQCTGAGWYGYAAPIVSNCADTSQPNCTTKFFGGDGDVIDSGGAIDSPYFISNSGNTTDQRSIGPMVGAGIFPTYRAQDLNTTTTSAGHFGLDLNLGLMTGIGSRVSYQTPGNATTLVPSYTGDAPGLGLQHGTTISSAVMVNAPGLGSFGGPCACTINSDCDRTPSGVTQVTPGTCSSGWCSVGATTCTQNSDCTSNNCGHGDVVAWTGVNITDTTGQITANSECVSARHPSQCCNKGTCAGGVNAGLLCNEDGSPDCPASTCTAVAGKGTCDSTAHPRKGIVSTVTAGTDGTGANNKWNLYLSGTAVNNLAGSTRIGDTAVPTNRLEITAPDGLNAKNTMLSVDLTGTNSKAPMYPIRLLPAGFTSGAVTNTELINIDSTMTMSGNGAGLVAYGFIPKIKNSTGVAVSSAITFGYSFRPTLSVDGSTFAFSGGLSGLFGFWGEPNFQQEAGAGAGTIDSYSTVLSRGNLNTGWTDSGDYRGLRMMNPIGTGGTISGALIGVDVESLTRGTTNFSLRSTGAQTMMHEGNVRIGSPSVAPSARLDVMQPSASTATPVIESGWNNVNFPSGASSETRTGVVINDSFSMLNNSGTNTQTHRGYVYEPNITISGQTNSNSDVVYGFAFNPTISMSRNTTVTGVNASGTWTNTETPLLSFIQLFNTTAVATSTTANVPATSQSWYSNNSTSKYDVASGSATTGSISGFFDQGTAQNVQAGGAYTVTDMDSFVSATKATQTAGTMTVTTRRGFRCKNMAGAGSATVTTNVCMDIESQTKGTTNLSFRSAGTQTMRHEGGVIVGSSTTAPSARVHITEGTNGNEILRQESGATGTPLPSERTYISRGTVTGAATLNLTLGLTTNSPTDPPCLSNSVCMIEARTVCHCTGGTSCTPGTNDQGATNVAIIDAKNVAGTISLLGAVTNVQTTQIGGASLTSITLSIAAPNAQVAVVGIANFNHTCTTIWKVQPVGT